MDSLYTNIGRKIKSLAKACFIVEAIAAVIAGIIMAANFDDLVAVGLLAIFAGPIVAWVASWPLYGFGEIVEKLSDISYYTSKSAGAPTATGAPRTASAPTAARPQASAPSAPRAATAPAAARPQASAPSTPRTASAPTDARPQASAPSAPRTASAPTPKSDGYYATRCTVCGEDLYFPAATAKDEEACPFCGSTVKINK